MKLRTRRQAPAPLALLTLALCALVSCSGGQDGRPEAADTLQDAAGADADADAAEPGPPENLFDTVWWPVGDESGILELLHTSPFFQGRPHLITEMSSWFHEVIHEVPGEEPASAEQLGYFALANGVSFAFTGCWYPLNTLHELLGPEFDNGETGGYFSDFRARIRRNGLLLPWTREWIWRPRKAAIPMTRMQVDGPPLELVTLAFAPMADPPGAARSTVVEVLLARNTGNTAITGVTVEVASYGAAAEIDGDSLDQVRGGDRMRVRPLDPGWSILETLGPHPDPVLLSAPFDLEPGAERALGVVYEFATDGDAIGAGYDAVSGQGWEILLDGTWAWWTGWHDRGLEIRTPDRRVDDLLEGFKETIRLQVGANGSVNQMSHYTGAWQRDVYPPVRALVKLGYLADAWSLADYMHGAAAVLGGIANRLPSDLELPDPLPEPDWLAAVPFTSDRLRGEGPSYLPLMHTFPWRYGGGGDRLGERWDYLIHTLRGQTITEEGMLYFSGDETFRPTFSANIGLGLDYPFEKEAWSAYSAFVFVAACEELARAALHEGLDRPDDIAWLQERAAWVRERTEAAYWLGDAGRYSAFIPMATGIPDEHCSPDVNTYPLYIGYQDHDAPRAGENLRSCMDLILQDNGMLQNISGLTEIFMDVDIGQGIYATPGATLLPVQRGGSEPRNRDHDLRHPRHPAVSLGQPPRGGLVPGARAGHLAPVRPRQLRGRALEQIPTLGGGVDPRGHGPLPHRLRGRRPGRLACPRPAPAPRRRLRGGRSAGLRSPAPGPALGPGGGRLPPPDRDPGRGPRSRRPPGAPAAAHGARRRGGRGGARRRPPGRGRLRRPHALRRSPGDPAGPPGELRGLHGADSLRACTLPDRLL